MRDPSHQRRQNGLTLIELMIALAVGSIIIAGTLGVYATSRNTYAINDAVGRLQEQARYVIAVVEPDIELGGYYGFTNAADALRLVDGATPGTVLANAAAMRQQPLPPLPAIPVAPPGLPLSAQACGVNFAVDVLTPVQGSNDVYLLGPGASAVCNPWGGGAAAGTDTLTVRRASTEVAAPEPGRLQIYASRLSSRSSQPLFFDGTAPGPIDADHAIHNLVVHTYYIDKDSVEQPGLPALRVKTLVNTGGQPGFNDNEVMSGVEDLQVQFGIDSGDYDNDGNVDTVADPNGTGIPDTDGRATRYVNPDFPGLDRLQVVAVRLWIRVRAIQPEPGFVDNRTYRYANVQFTPAGTQRNYRRVLLSRTVALRNSRTL